MLGWSGDGVEVSGVTKMEMEGCRMEERTVRSLRAGWNAGDGVAKGNLLH